ncbi:MAG: hypothetical protein ACRD23_00340 [Terriglobales bacterium]
MSRFDEMCAAFATGQKARDAYEQRCVQNLARLVQDFAAYCAFPDGMLKIVPLDKEIDHKMTYFLPSVANESDDGFWNVGLWITVMAKPHAMQWAELLIALSVAENDSGKTVVKIAERATPRPIDPADPQQLNEFCERLVGMIKKSLVGKPQSGQPSDDNAIGFKIGQTT